MAVAGTEARWTWIWPALAWTILLVTLVLGGSGIVYAAAGAALFGTVFAAVCHAEVVAHRVGEPFGTLILALAVTKVLAREANRLLQPALPHSQWADMVVDDLIESDSHALRAPDRMRRAAGLGRYHYGAIALTSGELSAAFGRR